MILQEAFTDIPTWDNGTWITTTFDTHNEFKEFVDSLFKEPGEYQFDETTLIFNEQSRRFKENQFYCIAPENTKDFLNYWDTEKTKSRKGVIFKNNGNTWYLTRYYYFWINFLKIYDKVKAVFDFPTVWDTQYHVSLYSLRCTLHQLHGAITKKRQIAMSYYFSAELINEYWFEQGAVLKIGASDKKYINDVDGTWKYLNEYADFLNKNTAWYRESNPGKMGNWKQVGIEFTQEGKEQEYGNKSTIAGITFEKSPVKGIGGPCMTAGHLIWMADGTLKPIEKIKIGNKIIGADGLPKRIKEIFSGEDETFRIIQERGMDYTVTRNHKLYLKDREAKIKEENRLKLLTPEEFLLLSSHKKQITVGVKNNKPIQFPHKNVAIDPYFLGAWLGDGYRDSTGIIVNKSLDSEILEEFSRYAEMIGGEVVTKDIKRKDYNYHMVSARIREKGSTRTNFGANILIPAFVKYNLFYNKHIPEEYLTNSIDVRAKLLAGLIDTDGYYDPKKGQFTIGTSNYIFAEQLRRLGISLGIYIRIDMKNHKGHDKVRSTVGYCVVFMTEDPGFIPTKVARKKSDYKSIKSKHTTPISVTPSGIQKYYGFECEDNLYLLEDGTITRNTKKMFYEEGGEAPTADITFQFIKPAMKMGEISTGTFMIAGSVGQLDKCDPLKEFTFRPKGNTILPVLNRYVDSKGTISETALFIPEQWSMLPYIDQYGNSLIPEALEALDKYFQELKITASPSNYQYEVSQHPRNLEEAYAYRKGSIFPLHLISAQMRRIDDKQYPYEHLDLYRDATGQVRADKSNKLPITEWPMDPKREDKEGVIVVWERPVNEIGQQRPKWMSYLGSIDPVRVGKTVTSDSLVSVYIYKTPVQITRKESDTVSTFIERDKIVASWCGRFSNINQTYKRLEDLLEWYNAWTVVENNITGFIQYMESQRKLRLLASKKDMLFLKEGQANQNIYQEVGWTNSGKIFTDNLLIYGIDYLTEELHHDFKTDGTIVRTTYGIERIPDYMLLKEMQGYQPGINVDRLIAYSALVAFAKLQIAHIGMLKREEDLDKDPSKSKKNSIFNKDRSMFHNIGNTSTTTLKRPVRNPFHNIR